MNILAAESANPLIPPLGEIVIGLIAFAIVLLAFFRFIAPRFEQVFRARREAIEGGIERAEAMQAEAKAALEQYRDRKSTRLNSSHANIVCRLLLENKKTAWNFLPAHDLLISSRSPNQSSLSLLVSVLILACLSYFRSHSFFMLRKLRSSLPTLFDL